MHVDGFINNHVLELPQTFYFHVISARAFEILILMCMDRGRWTIAGNPLDLRDTRLLAIAEAERHFLEAEYDDYAASNDSGAAFCRSAALIVGFLILVRRTLFSPCQMECYQTFHSCISNETV